MKIIAGGDSKESLTCVSAVSDGAGGPTNTSSGLEKGVGDGEEGVAGAGKKKKKKKKNKDQYVDGEKPISLVSILNSKGKDTPSLPTAQRECPSGPDKSDIIQLQQQPSKAGAGSTESSGLTQASHGAMSEDNRRMHSRPMAMQRAGRSATICA